MNTFKIDIIVMATTIQIKNNVKARLDEMKIFNRETYNDVLERILEDLRELNEETREEIKASLEEIKRGKYKTHEDLGKETGF